jgi:hypothetical protein|tara:strand:+ start:641 stop:1210 length:570 start_codon:yes stop_codon:yes gene_type:complete
MANLITLSTYKDVKGISATTHDFVLSTLIESVSQLVKTYCGNSIVDHYTTNKEEEFTINWSTSVVQLTEAPLNSVVSVQERTEYTAAYTTLTTDEYYADLATDSLFRVSKVWPTGLGSVKVTYKAGYADCPSDLKLAVIDLITYYHKDEHKSRQTLAGASLQNQSSSSMRNNIAFPDHIKRVLDLYKTF